MSNGYPIPQSEVSGLIDKTETLTKKLTADLNKDVASSEVQEIVKELIAFINVGNNDIDMGNNYWSTMAENYISNPIFIEVNDRKYGDGASAFIGNAIKNYLN